MKRTSRRNFLKNASLTVAAASLCAASPLKQNKSTYRPFRRKTTDKRVIILGMDGVDPELVRRFVAEGRMPTFAKFLSRGTFGKLRTTMPPQSPVAWASFITGTGPGGHGIYDFIHRDPTSFTPYLSTTRSYNPERVVKLGKWALPLDSGKVELKRFGRPFWSVLEEHDIPATIFQIPANFPVIESPSQAISGMGTPDLLGTYGTFTYFSESPVADSDKFVGGRVVRLRLNQHQVRAPLVGPKNAFSSEGADTDVEVKFSRDPINDAVTIDIQGTTLLLRKGEWSEWVPVRFEYVPHLMSAAGMVRFYVKEVHPRLKVYCSPINIDPVEPTLPIASPPDYAAEVASHIGRFYTQGFPADTKALSLKVLDDEEYFEQAKIVLRESMQALEYGLSKFNEGVFFFYFSSIDQNSHMLLRTMDPNHPLYDPKASPEIKNAMRYFYDEMDRALAMTLPKVTDDTLLYAISDHGFSTFYREFHLSTWLVQQGFTVLTNPEKMEESNFYDFVDWKKTKAYALGLNGIYINRSGREKHGVVSEEEATAVKREIIARLQTVRDPKNGQQIVTEGYDADVIYAGPFRQFSPDIVVGYQPKYRISDEAVLGKFPRDIVGDRLNKWSADHCVDAALVPGMILSNRECKVQDPGLWDMAPTILSEFGLKPLPEMTGRIIT